MITANTTTAVIAAAQRLLLSSLLTGLNSNSTDWEERVVLVRIFLLLYNKFVQEEVNGISGESKVETFLSISLSVICKSINQNQREEQHCVLLGRALTLIARQSSDSFRRLILQLSDEDKQYLQLAMKLALQQEQQQTTHSTGSSTSIGGTAVKSINMDKYRK